MKAQCREVIQDLQENIYNIITSKSLTHEQKVSAMASAADGVMNVLSLPAGFDYYKSKNIICDLFEGNAPLRPRYIIPDYSVLFNRGCSFLNILPPRDLDEALNALMIFYRHVPSVTNFPVYIGDLDNLLEPFVKEISYKEAKKKLKLFLNYIDRTITDSFCHADIGPAATVTGKILLELERELHNSVPNMTIKYDPDVTPDDFAQLAVLSQLAVAKPSFANDKMFRSELGDNYVIASCYNGLLNGGGAYTLVRVLLGNLAKEAKSSDDFLSNIYPACHRVMSTYMDERIRFIVEESNFFESNFLSLEGFISKSNFSAMFGMVGLAECVNTLMQKDGKSGRFGHCEEADQLGIKIMDLMKKLNDEHTNYHCKGFNNHFMLHGQVGIDTDTDQTPNVRIPIGEEPEKLSTHLSHTALYHGYFPSGVGEIFKVEPTVTGNPDFILDIVKGAFKKGVRYLSIHNSDSDIIRVTGYLVKRSEVEKLDKGNSVRQGNTAFGLGAIKNNKVLNRRVREVRNED